MNLDQLEVPLSQFATLIFVIDIQVRATVISIALYTHARHRIYTNLPLPSSSRWLLPHITRVRVSTWRYLCTRRTPCQKSTGWVRVAAPPQSYSVLSDDVTENWRYIQQRILDELGDISPEYEQMIPINFHLTSIHDHTLHDAFSRTLHKSIESLPYLEDLLNVFCTVREHVNKVGARVADIIGLDRIPSRRRRSFSTSTPDYTSQRTRRPSMLRLTAYVTTTFSCSIHLDPCISMWLSLSAFTQDSPSNHRSVTLSSARHKPPTPPPPATPTASLPASPRLSSGPNSMPSSVPRSPLLSSRTPPTVTPSPTIPTRPDTDQPPPVNGKAKALFYPSASATLAPSTVGVPAGTTLTYHVVTKRLALLALIPTAVWEQRRGLVEYNVVFFREGVQEICDVEEEVRGGG